MPAELVGDKANIYTIFLHCAKEYADNRDYATQLVRLLPKSIKEAPVWFEKMTKLWRYEYGLPLTNLPGGTAITGTNVHLPVHELYLSLRIAERRLQPQQLLRFLERLSDREKHSDVLFEMRPMKDVAQHVKAFYEVEGLGIGNTTCDWQIHRHTFRIVLDVKNRTKSLVDHMKYLIPSIDSRVNDILPPPPDPADLFRSLEAKFKESFPLFQLQGVWIQSQIMEHEESLMRHFSEVINKRKVHFAILSDWKEDAFILTRNRLTKYFLKRIFRITESKRFVTSDYSRTIKKTT